MHIVIVNNGRSERLGTEGIAEWIDQLSLRSPLWPGQLSAV
jgi:hypothetical protein